MPAPLRQPILRLLSKWTDQLTHLLPERYDLRGKTALVTGGSRGLGLEIARVLVVRGANVVLLARDEAELDNAVLDLHDRRRDDSVHVAGHRCDLSDSASIRATLDTVRQKHGPVDVLVNNAGMIQVGPLDAMTLDDFDAAMQLHFAAPLRMSLWLRDEMRERGGGRIANIASIGGVVSVPHLLPYSASKFALMGLSQGLRSELARDNIFVSTIAPGLMRTGSPRQALFKGDHEKEYAWFKIADSLPLLSVSSARAAERIVRAIERGEAYVLIGLPAKLAALAAGIAPAVVSQLMAATNALLPDDPDPDSRRGFESESPITRSAITELTDRAAVSNNEVRSTG